MSQEERIYLASPHMSAEGYEQEYIQEAFATNWIAPLGANVNGFEEELSKKVGIRSAAALSSGTAAIHLALKCLGVGSGDLVFCQSLTFSASANPIRYPDTQPVGDWIEAHFYTLCLPNRACIAYWELRLGQFFYTAFPVHDIFGLYICCCKLGYLRRLSGGITNGEG